MSSEEVKRPAVESTREIAIKAGPITAAAIVVIAILEALLLMAGQTAA